jgi:hypothetical protein
MPSMQPSCLKYQTHLHRNPLHKTSDIPVANVPHGRWKTMPLVVALLHDPALMPCFMKVYRRWSFRAHVGRIRLPMLLRAKS